MGKKLILFFGMLVLAGCVPGSSAPSPTATPTPVFTPVVSATPISVATSVPTFTLTSTRTLTPTRTRTPTPAPTPTFAPTPLGFSSSGIQFPTTPLPLPVGFTLKLGEGVSATEREHIQTGCALAQKFLGTTRPITVLADSDLDKLLESYSKEANIAPTSPSIAKMKHDFEVGFTAFGGGGRITIYITDGWKRGSKEGKWATIAHEYFHNMQGQSGVSLEPTWLVEGTSKLWDRRFLVELGIADYQRARLGTIAQTRGLLGALETMETTGSARTEDYTAPYLMGFLASECLILNYGETKVYPEFWQKRKWNIPWQATFEQVFGVPPKEFYKKFEEYHQKEFPPYCTQEDGATGDFGIRFVRRMEPGTAPLETSDYTLTATPYVFCLRGIQFGLLSNKEQSDAVKRPTGSQGWISCSGNCIILYMNPTARAGDTTFAIQLPDGRRKEIVFTHQ